MKLAFLGTPEPAAQVLDQLVSAGHSVELVVSRPDRRRGRGGNITASPVKETAHRLGLHVSDDVNAVLDAEIDLAVVVGYGRLISADILSRTPMLNVHYSLLPRWRGAAPVERAILAGDTETGVCIMRLVEALDEGPVYTCKAVPISETDTAADLRNGLTAEGARLLLEVLAAPLSEPRPQEGTATYAEKISPEDVRLRFKAMTAEEVHRRVRVGGAWALSVGRRVKVLAGRPGTGDNSREEMSVAVADGQYVIAEVIPEGSRRMTAGAWARGRGGAALFDE